MLSVMPPETDEDGRVVALVATETAVQQGWGASAAVDLARSWSANGHRVILVDASLEAPSLHGAVGLPNREGVSDAALFGASVGRVSRAVDDGRFYLITAGTPVARTEAVMEGGRWGRVMEGMTEAGVLVLLYLTATDGGAAAFLPSASDVVLLAGPGDPAPVVVQDHMQRVHAVVGPETGPSARAAAARAGSRGGRAGSAGRAAATPGAPGNSLASPLTGDSGAGKAILFIIGAILAAAGLGYLITSVL